MHRKQVLFYQLFVSLNYTLLFIFMYYFDEKRIKYGIKNEIKVHDDDSTGQ